MASVESPRQRCDMLVHSMAASASVLERIAACLAVVLHQWPASAAASATQEIFPRDALVQPVGALSNPAAAGR